MTPFERALANSQKQLPDMKECMYNVNDRIRFRNVGMRSRYYVHRHKEGKITSKSPYGGSVHVLLDDGTVLRNVGYSVIEPMVINHFVKNESKQTLIHERNKKLEELNELNAKIAFCEDFGLEAFDSKLYKAAKLENIINNPSAEYDRITRIKQIAELI
jgi:hypothetical protein